MKKFKLYVLGFIFGASGAAIYHELKPKRRVRVKRRNRLPSIIADDDRWRLMSGTRKRLAER